VLSWYGDQLAAGSYLYNLLAMPDRRLSPRKAHKQLLDLVRKGKLFALQEWIKAGKPLCPPKSYSCAPRILVIAVRTGFHSLVEELLRVGPWPAREMADSLKYARSQRRYDIADLLLNQGAEPENQDFATVCELLDFAMMERHLRAGTNPNQDNVFARILCSTKARPLLGFYRRVRAEFPALDDQAALALSEAVKENQVRWTALLIWAGADPLRSVPNDLDGAFPVDPENSTTAAEEAIWRKNPEILKLRLRPNPPQAVALLSQAGNSGNQDLFRTLLSPLPADQLNTTARGSCAPLERLVSHWGRRGLGGHDQDRDAKTLECIELLVDAGARWNPAPEELRHIRRHLMEHEPRYIVQLLRLLMYTPNAANIENLIELCRSQTLQSKIAAADPPLVHEIKQFRKARFDVTTSIPNDRLNSTPVSAVASQDAL
jgi:hypothetical protein